MTQKEERRRYWNALAITANISRRDIEALHRLAGRLQRFQEAYCSFEWLFLRGQWVRPEDCGEGEKIKTALKRWLDRVNNGRLPDSPQMIEMQLQGDPRGAVVKLRGAGLPCTSLFFLRCEAYGGEGWFCIEAKGYNTQEMDRLIRASYYYSEAVLRKRELARKAEAATNA